MSTDDPYGPRLRRIRWRTLALAAPSLTAVEAYCYCIRGVLLIEDIVVWLIGMTVAAVFIGVGFRHAERLQGCLQEEVAKNKRAQRAFRESEERYRGLFDNSTDFSFVLDLRGHFTEVNRAAEAITGFPQAELMGMGFRKYVPPEQQERVSRAFQQVFDTGKSLQDFPLEVVVKDGTRRYFETSVIPLRRRGKIIGFHGSSRDITARKKAEETLREQTAKYQIALRGARAGGWEYDLRTRKGVWDDTVYRNYGLRPGSIEISMEDTVARLHPEDSEQVKADLRQALRTKGSWESDIHIVWPDGSVHWLHSAAEILRDDTGRAVRVIGLNFDITKRKRMDAELIQVERLRALGELSAGVSHNLNNILTCVLGPAQMLQMITDDPKVLQEARTIFTSALRARDLVHRLHLSTWNAAEDRPQPVRVNEIVLEAVDVARPRWKDEPEAKGLSVEVVTDLSEVPPVKGAWAGLYDVFVNLIFNAVDAMPDGGRITIMTQAVEEGARITVSDTGIGMEEDVKRRVFEPFFTTKMDVGSGLGLSTSYAAVTRWGGTMDVESAPG